MKLDLTMTQWTHSVTYIKNVKIITTIPVSDFYFALTEQQTRGMQTLALPQLSKLTLPSPSP